MIYCDGRSYYKLVGKNAHKVTRPFFKQTFSLALLSEMQVFILKGRFGSKDLALSECIKRGAKWDENLGFIEHVISQNSTLCIIYEQSSEHRLPVFMLPMALLPKKDAVMFCIKDSISIYQNGKLVYVDSFGDESDIFQAIERAEGMNLSISKIYSELALESSPSASLDEFGAHWEAKMASIVAKKRKDLIIRRRKKGFIFSTLFVPFLIALLLYYYYLDSKIDTIVEPGKRVLAPAYESLYQELAPVINLVIQEGIAIKKLLVLKNMGRDEIVLVLSSSPKNSHLQDKFVSLGFEINSDGAVIRASRRSQKSSK